MADATGPFGSRYALVRELGSGGMGTVYEVLDLAQGSRRIALKVLREGDADSVLRLKREFRSLADARHQNLVSLYELNAGTQRCFFTLELIDGTDLTRWLRPQTVGRQEDAPTGKLERTVPSASGQNAAVDFEKVSAAFRQLAEGIAALHSMGHLHRDLKPSNVMVTREGRVVILDFGLVAPAVGGAVSFSEAQGHIIAGTAAYMAPEQASSSELSPAADWYAFGVMLFEALTGALPFGGTALQMMLDKQRLPARSIFELSAQVPHSLATLCMTLLRRLPAERATAKQVIAALGGTSEHQQGMPLGSASIGLAGRELELALLNEALAKSRSATQVVRVLGESGIGKTALVRACLERAREQGAVVLLGRCSERESVPFKALDGVIDALATHLASLPIERADALLPRDANALAKMFPVLRRAKGFREAAERAVQDPVELRRRAVGGLRELLTRLADRRAVILFIDDAQWADRDSRDVLNDVVRGEDAPAVLIVTASRAGPGERGLVSGPVASIELGPLPYALCEVLAAKTSGLERAQAVALESRGNPFLLLQLAHFGRDKMFTLAELMALRLNELRPSERALVEIIALAGAPLRARVALDAAGLGPAGSDAIFGLKSARLIRSSSDERLEIWHERLRDGVLGQIAPGSIAHAHRVLGETLEALPAPADDEVELTAIHLAAAGLAERASAATLRAACTARQQLAFDRAATLFERALQQLNRLDPLRRAIAVAWGDTLSLAGRGASAAAAYRLAISFPLPAALESSAFLQLPARERELTRSRAVALGSEAVASSIGAEPAARRSQSIPSQAVKPSAPGAGPAAGGSSPDAEPPGRQSQGVPPPGSASSRAPAALAELLQTEASTSNLELNRRSAEALLRAGHIDEGLLAVHEVLGELGMTLAKTPRRALAALALRRLHVRLRGLTFTPRIAAAVRPETLSKIDACWSVSVGLAMVDTIRGASFQTRQLLLALDAGEPFRVSRALAAEAAFVATGGVADEARARALIERARALALNAPVSVSNDLIGLIDFCHGLTRFLVGDWSQARTFSAQAERRFSELGAPVSWEAASARLFSVWSLFYLGDIEELSARLPALLEEAEARGDLYAITSLRCGLANVALLAAGDPLAARAAVREVMARWSSTSFHFQHYWALLSEGLIDLYEGKAADGWARTEAAWPQLTKSQLLRIQNVRIEASFLRARLALATGRHSAAAAIARALEREGVAWATGFAELIHAALSPAKASVHLANALTAFESQQMALFAAAARLRLASTQPHSLRDENERASLGWLRGQRIADPVRLAAILVPDVVPHGSNLTLSLG